MKLRLLTFFYHTYPKDLAMARMNPKKGDKEPKVHKELDGFDININTFGEITTSYDIAKLNKFLDKNVEDKKLVVRDDYEGPRVKYPNAAALKAAEDEQYALAKGETHEGDEDLAPMADAQLVEGVETVEAIVMDEHPPALATSKSSDLPEEEVDDAMASRPKRKPAAKKKPE